MLYTVVVTIENKTFAENFIAKNAKAAIANAVMMTMRYGDVKKTDIFDENGQLIYTME